VHLLQVSFGHCRPLAASQVIWKERPGSTPQICIIVDDTLPHLLVSPWNPKNMQFCKVDHNCVACWQVSFGILWTVSQVFLTDFTTFSLATAPVKLANLTFWARRKSYTRLLHKRDLRSVLSRDINRNKPPRQKRVQLERLGGWICDMTQMRRHTGCICSSALWGGHD